MRRQVGNKGRRLRRVYRKRAHKGPQHLFGWTIFFTVLIALVAFIWLFCLYVFGHPEKPLCYRFLKKVNKLPPPKKFYATKEPRVPHNKFYTAKDFYLKLSGYDAKKLKTYNTLVRRDYVENYQRLHKPIIDCLTGTYRIQQIQMLTPQDFFPQGIVVRAQSTDFPLFFIDYLLTSPSATEQSLTVGNTFTLEGNSSFAAVLHVEKLTRERLVASVLPLLYGEHTFSSQKIVLSPPTLLNMRASWPIIKE